MDFGYLTQELKRNKNVFRSLLGNIEPDLYLWRQTPEKWCLLEIICHLYDEEREDFRARVKHIVENPDLPFVPIDPVGWVASRKYLEKDYRKVLDDFLGERDNSVGWLETLKNPKWVNVYRHPTLGNLTAQMIFENWIAHDYLHFRQIVRLKYDYLGWKAGENLSYAGTW